MRTRDENKLNQIYKATLKLVSEVGIAGISIAAIAKEAGIGTGSFYTYFTSKDDLINALYKETQKVYSNKLFSNYSDDDPVKIGMKKIFINYLQYRLNYYENSIFQDQYLLSPYAQGNEDARQFTIEILSPLINLLEKGKKELVVKNVDNKYHFMLLIGFVNELALMMRLRDWKATNEFIDTSFNLFWDAVKQ